MGARAILLNWPKFEDGIPLFREVHQQSPGADVDVVISNCKAAANLLAQVNKNPTMYFLKCVLPKMDIPEDWGLAFVREMFSSMFVLNMHLHAWDDNNRTMTSPSDE